MVCEKQLGVVVGVGIVVVTIALATSVQGRSKRVDRVDHVLGPRGSRGPTKMIPLVWGLLTVPCSWAPEGLATPVCGRHQLI